MTEESAEYDRIRLAALALIELVVRQLVNPHRAGEHGAELEVILTDVDPAAVCLELATIAVAVAQLGSGYDLKQHIDAARVKILMKDG